MRLKKLAFLGFCLVPNLALAVLPVGQLPPQVSLHGETGGRVDGSPWNSDDMKGQGKVHLLVYSNVSHKDLNDEATQAVKAAGFPRDKFASVAVVNMKGSWQPNFMISKAIESKQKDYPDTTYVKDMDKVLVKQWRLQDETNNVVLLDHNGLVAFSVDGKLSPAQVKALLETIKVKIAEMASPSAPTTPT